MKYLILLRHGNSEDNSPDGTDYARRLNQRGIREVRETAQHFLNLNLEPTLLLCSAATRTRETMATFLQASDGIKPETVLVLDSLYHAPASSLLETIEAEGSGQPCILIVGHNPGISDLAQRLSGGACPGLPTSGMAVIGYDQDPIEGKLLHYIVPAHH